MFETGGRDISKRASFPLPSTTTNILPQTGFTGPDALREKIQFDKINENQRATSAELNRTVM